MTDGTEEGVPGVGNGVGRVLEVGKEMVQLRNNKETVLAKSQDSYRGVLREQSENADWN